METGILYREINPEVRVADAARGLVDYVASDETLDCYAEVIRAAGWRFNRFGKNAPFVDSHDTYGIRNLLGKVVGWELKGGQLHERVQYALDVEENDLARFAFNMVAKGYLRAVSVGFFPVKMLWRSDGEEFAKAAAEMGMGTEQAAAVRAIHYEQEQIELSQCIIGANPAALAKAFKDGAASEEDMARLGFGGDADFEFLQLAAATWDDADAAARHATVRELGQIYARRNKANVTPAGQHPGAGDRQRDAAGQDLRALAETFRDLERRRLARGLQRSLGRLG